MKVKIGDYIQTVRGFYVVQDIDMSGRTDESARPPIYWLMGMQECDDVQISGEDLKEVLERHIDGKDGRYGVQLFALWAARVDRHGIAESAKGGSVA